MRVVLTGAAGLIGKGITALLLAHRALAGRKITQLTLSDRGVPQAPKNAPFPVRCVACDVRELRQVEETLGAEADAVFHLAAVMSGPAESDYALGWSINLDGSRNVFEACRRMGKPPIVLFSSTTAIYGEGAPDPVPDDYAPRPKNAYGTQKAMIELMLSEYSRRGFIDGRVVRLSGVAVRTDDTHLGAAAFISAIVRSPLLGQEAVCPVPTSMRIGIITPETVFASMIHLANLPPEAFQESRVIQLPALTLRVAELIEAVRRAGGDQAVARIRMQPDPALISLRKGIPISFSADRARRLGFPQARDIDAVIEEFLRNVRPAASPA
jgi:nucleoside-diphosphate-sugar epimerase